MKIRKEKTGAYLFNKENGIVKYLDDSEFELIKDYHDIIYPQIPTKDLPDDCFSAPSKVYFELTRKCNLRCRMCYNSAGQSFDSELSKEHIFDVLKDLSNAGTFEVRFTGGEPTTRSDFFEIVDFAHKLGFFISIGTNGVWEKGFLEKIAKSPIDMIIISIEGPKEIHEKIRGIGTLKKSIDSLSYLSKNSDKILRINTTLAKYNFMSIEYIVKIADKLDIPVINTMPIRFSGRSKDYLSKELLAPSDYLKFIKHIERLRKRYKVSIQSYFDVLGEKSRWLENQTSLINKKTCAAGVEACLIAPSGDVYGCAASNPSSLDKITKKMFVTGNIKKEKIMDIWFDSKRWKIYRDFRLNKSKKCFSCNFYMKKCFGNCFVSSLFSNGKLDANDPYCFAHMIKSSGVE